MQLNPLAMQSQYMTIPVNNLVFMDKSLLSLKKKNTLKQNIRGEPPVQTKIVII